MLKAVVTTLDDVAEEHKALYKERDGKFYLELEGGSADELFPGDIAGLKSSLEKERKAREAAEAAAKAAEGVDAEEYKTLKAEAEKNRSKKMIDEGKVDELVEERTRDALAAKEKELVDLRQERDTLAEQLDDLVINSELTSAALSVGVDKKAVRAALALARPGWERDGDKPVLKKDGNVVYGSDTTPKTPEEYLTELVQEHAYLLGSSEGGGGGHDKGGGKPPTKPIKEWTEREKIDWINEHGHEEYEKLLGSQLSKT